MPNCKDDCDCANEKKTSRWAKKREESSEPQVFVERPRRLSIPLTVTYHRYRVGEDTKSRKLQANESKKSFWKHPEPPFKYTKGVDRDQSKTSLSSSAGLPEKRYSTATDRLINRLKKEDEQREETQYNYGPDFQESTTAYTKADRKEKKKYVNDNERKQKKQAADERKRKEKERRDLERKTRKQEAEERKLEKEEKKNIERIRKKYAAELRKQEKEEKKDLERKRRKQAAEERKQKEEERKREKEVRTSTAALAKAKRKQEKKYSKDYESKRKKYEAEERKQRREERKRAKKDLLKSSENLSEADKKKEKECRKYYKGKHKRYEAEARRTEKEERKRQKHCRKSTAALAKTEARERGVKAKKLESCTSLFKRRSLRHCNSLPQWQTTATITTEFDQEARPLQKR